MALGRIARIATVAVIVAAISFCVTWRVVNVQQVSRAKKSFEVLRNLRVGQKVNTNELKPPWHCSRTDGNKCSFQLGSWPSTKGTLTDFINSSAKKLHIPLWLLLADVELDESGIVTKRHFLLVTTDYSNGYAEPGISMSDAHLPQFLFAQSRHRDYEVRRLQKGPSLLIVVGQNADPVLVQHATNVNFDCLNRLRGNCSFSELAPSAWADYLNGTREDSPKP